MENEKMTVKDWVLWGFFLIMVIIGTVWTMARIVNAVLWVATLEERIDRLENRVFYLSNPIRIVDMSTSTTPFPTKINTGFMIKNPL